MGEDSAHGSGSKPELVVLGSMRKQAEQAMMNKPVSSTPPWPSITFCLQVPPPLFEELRLDSTFFFYNPWAPVYLCAIKMHVDTRKIVKMNL